MKLRRASPIVLLLAAAVGAQQQQQPHDHAVEDIAAQQTDANAGSAATFAAAATKAYVGTADAPVDGKDGKPHAGPFVDWDSSAQPKTGGDVAAISDKYASSEIPEKHDGVMNDENRPVAKKGTTGTEGGISERTKAQVNNKQQPAEPKEAAALPPSEQDTTPKQDATTGAVKKDAGGMEKPADLPESPYAEPKAAKQGTAVEDTDRSKWLVKSMPDTEGKTNLNPPKNKNKQSNSKATKSRAEHDDHETWHELFHSFVLSFAMIIVSEIGDKTFLVAALMAMRHARLLVFSAALAALVAMTVLSAVLGHAFPTLLPKKLTTFAAAILFFVFGAKSLHEGLHMDADAGIGEEMREVEAELEEKEHDMALRGNKSLSSENLESGRGSNNPSSLNPASFAPKIRRPGHGAKPAAKGALAGLSNLFSLILSPAWVSTFVMTFLGEWGDRSQIATIAMAAGQDYWWVTLGAIAGHACCTGLAVIGGRALAGRVSMRVVTIGGAIAFLLFGVIYLYECLID